MSEFKTFSFEEIKEKLAHHYGGSGEERDLHVKPFKDSYGEVGSVHISLSGSPPKGYAIYTPESNILSLYDWRGKRFKKYWCSIDGEYHEEKILS